MTEQISDWFANLSPLGWIGLVIAVLIVLFLLRNVPDIVRYIRIRAM
jgi:hypothetical protein